MVADALSIGLVEWEKGSGPKALNKWAEDLFTSYEELREKIASSWDQWAEEVVVRTTDQKAFQIRRLNSHDDCHDLYVIQEVTQAFELAERIKKQEKLALLGQMTAQIAHQLKTPLAILAGKAQMLSKKIGGNPLLRQRAQDIFNEARELARQVDEISSFYKKGGPRITEVTLGPLFQRLKDRLKPFSQAVSIYIDCPEDLKIRTDPSLLLNLLFLLGQNALEPRIKATVLEISARIKEDNLFISLCDDGIGIPTELGKRIFEPFVGTREDGLGLGLFLAKDLSRQLGGDITLLDRSKGSCFLIKIPTSGPAFMTK